MTDDEKAIAVINAPLSVTDFNQGYQALLAFVKKSLKQDKDYGVIPYTKGGKTLLQPGAEKIAKFFGLMPDTVTIDKVEDWEKGFFFYRAKCTLTHFHTGKFAGSATRTSNSKEKSFGNSFMGDLPNKVEARAHKRAIVAAIRFATNATDIFDEDAEGNAENIQPGTYTKKDNPEKAAMMAKLFAAASERCFSAKLITGVLHKQYGVDSTNELNGEQLMEAYTKLNVEWKIGGKDGKPCKITDTSTATDTTTPPIASPEASSETGETSKQTDTPTQTDNSPQTAESGVIVDDQSTNKLKQEHLLDGDVPVDDITKANADFSKDNKIADGMDDIRVCRHCNKTLDPQDSDQRKAAKLPVWFCNKECETGYWGDLKRKKSPSEKGYQFSK